MELIIPWSSCQKRRGWSNMKPVNIFINFNRFKKKTSARKNGIFRWTSFTMATFYHVKISRNTYTHHTHYSWDIKVSTVFYTNRKNMRLNPARTWYIESQMQNAWEINNLISFFVQFVLVVHLFLHYPIINLCIKL